MGDWLGESVLNKFNYIFRGGMFEAVGVAVREDPSSSASIFSSAWNLVCNVYQTYILPVGLGLMIIWFLVGFIQKATSEQMNFDHLFLSFVKLIAAFYLMNNGLTIMAKIWELGNSLAGSLNSLGGTESTLDPAELSTAWSSLMGTEWNGGAPKYPAWYKSLIATFELLLPYAIASLLSGITTFIIYSRMIEMLVRIAGAPIALSDFMHEGFHSSGWRYLKSFLAVCLQGFVILLIAQIYSSIMLKTVTYAGFMETCVSYFVISFAAVSLMFKSQTLCKELVGAA